MERVVKKMKIKNCLLMILLSIFMIFAFYPIASAHGAEEPEVKTETQVKEDIIDKQIEKNEETTEKKEKAEPENETTPRALTETNSAIKETETKKEEEKESKITQKSDTAVVKPEKSQTKEEILEETEEPKEKSSSYTVEFTHKDLQYVLPGGTSVKLAKILDKLEIKGNKITEVECSDNNLFSATNESGEWVINSHKAFHTDEHLYVTIDGTKYNIKVTDYSLPNNRWKWYDSACTIAVTKDRLDDNSGNVQTIYGYYYYQTRTLVIEGSGVIKDYSEQGSPMWNMCGDINLSTGNYVEHIEMGDGITTIGKNFFWAVNRSESNSSQKKEFTVHLPTSLQTIGPYAFQHSGAYIVYIPDSVTTIGQGAFDNCPQLSKVLIPNSVTTISSGAFSNTKNGCEFFVGATLGGLGSACGGNVSTRFGNHANQYFHWHGQKNWKHYVCIR